MIQRSEDRRPAPRRVVITGIGAITPIGTGVEGMWDGLRKRESAVRRISRFDPTPFRSHIAAQVDDFDPETYMERNRARRMERYAQFSVAASRQALEDAALDPAGEDPERVGVQMGSALGGVAYGETQFTSYVERACAAWTRCWRSPCSTAPRRATSPSSSGSPAPTAPTG
jgi:3-oxoacyl-[acyl-carrier-protein] synthase II